MTELRQVYKCEICGNIVEVLHTGAGELVCCGEPMKLQTEHTGDEGTEKHTPVIIAQDNGILIKVGDVPHPMEEKHWIQWIEVLTPDRTYRQTLTSEDEPQASFPVKIDDVIKVREYCNLHGLWKDK